MAAFSRVLAVCIMVGLVCAATEPQEVTAKPGEDVPLQCRDPKGADIRLIEWKRPDLKPEKYVFFFRDNKTIGEYQIEEFRGRVELRDPEMKDGDASVVLKNVNINDTGTYECWVSAASRGRRRRAAEVFSTIRLTVTDSGLTAGQEGGDKDRNLGWKVGLPVGGLLLLLLLLLRGVVMFRNRRRRQEINDQPPAEEEIPMV